MQVKFLKMIEGIRVVGRDEKDLWTKELSITTNASHLVIEFDEQKNQVQISYKDKVICIVPISNIVCIQPKD